MQRLLTPSGPSEGAGSIPLRQTASGSPVPFSPHDAIQGPFDLLELTWLIKTTDPGSHSCDPGRHGCLQVQLPANKLVPWEGPEHPESPEIGGHWRHSSRLSFDFYYINATAPKGQLLHGRAFLPHAHEVGAAGGETGRHGRSPDR